MEEKQLSLLIIDDNQRLLDTYSEFFVGEGFLVYTALEGSEGLKKAQQAIPSVILLDLMLPGLDGLEVLHRLKADEKTKNIPIIVLTALLHGAEEKASMQAGAVAYVEKVETDPDSLLAKVRRAIKDQK